MRNFSGNGRTRSAGQGTTCVSARCGSRAGRTKPPPMGEVPPEGAERAVNRQPSQPRPAAVPAPPEGEPNTVHPISPGKGRPACRPACGFTVGGGEGRKPTALSATARSRHRSFNNSLQIGCTSLLTKSPKGGILALGNRECQHYQPGECQTPPHEPEETADTENS